MDTCQQDFCLISLCTPKITWEHPALPYVFLPAPRSTAMGRQGDHCCLGWSLGDRGQWGQGKAVPSPSILSGSQDQQLSPAAHSQLLLSFSCHEQLRVVRTQTYQSPAKGFPRQEQLLSALLATSIKKQDFEEAKAPSPSLPPGAAGDQPSRAGVGAAGPPAHTAARAASPAAATAQGPTRCFMLPHKGLS